MNFSDNFEIDEYVAKYQDEVLNLIVQIQQKEFGIPISAEDQPDLCNIEGFYQNGKGNFWVALFKKEVIGTISLLDIGNNQAALRKMFVNQLYRGKRLQVALLLLNSLLQWSQLNNVEEIYLGTTPKFLAAHRFYEKNGFTEIIKNELPTAFPIMKVDTKFYQFSVKKS